MSSRTHLPHPRAELGLVDLVLLGFAGAAALLAVFMASVGTADAANASNKTTVAYGGDRLYNYDFLSQDQQAGTSGNVDWAVTMIFRNNAEVDKVKNYYWDTWACASGKNGRFLDGTAYEWDSDAGAKSRCTLLGDVYHMRVYGDEDDRMYDSTYGYWVFATTHIDHNEQLLGEWFGESEKSEEWWAAWARGKGWSTCSDCKDMFNNEPYRAEGNHRWNNNRYATIVNVP